jgi:MOSC domain-containing protein YiiM
MALTCPRLIDVRTGHARRIDGHVTAYAKQSRTGPVAVRPLGLEGDEVANTRVHGGPEKAVYAYAAANYPLWIADHPHHAERLVPGAFGENLLIEGLDETSVCIGDQWRIGSALLQPCQPRQPCATLARWFGDPAMVKAMAANGRSGWYLQVVEPGMIEAGDTLRLMHRPEGAWTIEAVLRASYTPSGSDELRALSEAPGLAASWAAWAARAASAARPAAKPL